VHSNSAIDPGGFLEVIELPNGNYFTLVTNEFNVYIDLISKKFVTGSKYERSTLVYRFTNRANVPNSV
jgi:hypothetical protein